MTATKRLSLSLLLLAAVAAAGCSGPPADEELVGRGTQACTKYGYAPDTAEFANCVQAEVRAAKARTTIALAGLRDRLYPRGPAGKSRDYCYGYNRGCLEFISGIGGTPCKEGL